MEAVPYVPIGISNRHVHLSQKDLEALFGSGYQLTKMKDLKQPGQFAAKETVVLTGPKGEIQNVRILGPVRGKTQVEISFTDSFKLGVPAPVRESGKIAGTPGLVLTGPAGKLELQEGVIAALRHIHVPPEFAEKFDLHDKEMVEVEVGSVRKTIFQHVLIRVSDKYVLEMHLDTDEANAAGVKNGELGKIRKG
ncbi:phosphate propanoyltransferase [Neobacillus sp. OS1-32]|uniref:phosphate propanoyltransferase n=1 Tax=Neobacillus sp. OS1-32 TaxID=3070682 RepID=UPI0027DFC5A5|nr:phosphate propanoyltransferase [Neobacillus sp. OS1-32]WML32455.1 phosphate propanoyltransferase [Neobacillus sp. OS1-32]